ncbi:hypothetical protein HCH52_02065 [Oscillospiraceae bacterium HV4-5-C5C]|nr:hypothetical protein [Oscillospiraceae bacterium HV4-5-C5C]
MADTDLKPSFKKQITERIDGLESLGKRIGLSTALLLVGAGTGRLAVNVSADSNQLQNRSINGNQILACIIEIILTLLAVYAYAHFSQRRLQRWGEGKLSKPDEPEFSWLKEEYQQQARHYLLLLLGAGLAWLLSLLLYFVLRRGLNTTESTATFWLLLTAGLGVYLHIKSSLCFYGWQLAVIAARQPAKPEDTKGLRAMLKFGAVLWTFMTIVYLILGLHFHQWAHAWLLYPIAGLTYCLLLTWSVAIRGLH